ncbi:unnamed protein product [Trichogramma brassicae]|uniref:Uncharacterized protein n=1 Tax=Trichogramma brassicae TaxID=86971 RepID=A0A6H5J0F5_9HYME|nr:unnamed protein product [Trichogramma brassicae]
MDSYAANSSPRHDVEAAAGVGNNNDTAGPAQRNVNRNRRDVGRRRRWLVRSFIGEDRNKKFIDDHDCIMMNISIGQWRGLESSSSSRSEEDSIILLRARSPTGKKIKTNTLTCVKTQEYLKVPEICPYLERGERRRLIAHARIDRGALISLCRAREIRPVSSKHGQDPWLCTRGPLVRILYRGTLDARLVIATLLWREIGKNCAAARRRRTVASSDNYTERASSAQQQQQRHAKRKDVRMYLYGSGFARIFRARNIIERYIEVHLFSRNRELIILFALARARNRGSFKGAGGSEELLWQGSGRRRRREKNKKTKCKTPKRLIPRYDDLAVQCFLSIRDSSGTLCSRSSLYTKPPRATTTTRYFGACHARVHDRFLHARCQFTCCRRPNPAYLYAIICAPRALSIYDSEEKPHTISYFTSIPTLQRRDYMKILLLARRVASRARLSRKIGR